MRAQQRNRLIWNIEQIERLTNMPQTQDDYEVAKVFDAAHQHATVALKIARADEATFAGRIPPIRPLRRPA